MTHIQVHITDDMQFAWWSPGGVPRVGEVINWRPDPGSGWSGWAGPFVVVAVEWNVDGPTFGIILKAEKVSKP